MVGRRGYGLALVFCTGLAQAQGAIHKCLQPDGVMLYSDQPCAVAHSNLALSVSGYASYPPMLQGVAAFWHERVQPLLVGFDLDFGARNGPENLHLQILGGEAFAFLQREAKAAVIFGEGKQAAVTVLEDQQGTDIFEHGKDLIGGHGTDKFFACLAGQASDGLSPPQPVIRSGSKV